MPNGKCFKNAQRLRSSLDSLRVSTSTTSPVMVNGSDVKDVKDDEDDDDDAGGVGGGVSTLVIDKAGGDGREDEFIVSSCSEEEGDDKGEETDEVGLL
mmetsp:Transcript_27914/g.33060  ORF Transcript_27914/g.33060 Transcript_27914/m.33060 type:complete len:98 (+) Transcript_27914:467-760(+)